MNPALVARIETSVTGRRRQSKAIRSITRRTSLLRLAAVVGLATPVAVMATGYRRSRAELTEARAALASEWIRQAGSLSNDEQALLGRTEAELHAFSGNYPGDLTAGELRPAGALGAVLGRPSLYVRGPIAAFGTAKSVARAARESVKDAFVLCLLDPPASREEKEMLGKARLALGGGDPAQNRAPSVHRLDEVVIGLPFFLPAWGESVNRARSSQELSELERALRKAPIGAARSALQARLLIAVLDEPKEGTGPTELDGEHSHHVRILLAGLPAPKPLLRMRRQVDPSWITPARRSRYARELDSCKLALDLHDTVTVTPSP
jgi:hypothetical protein